MEHLPKGWSQHKTKEGKVYYYNSESKKSSWTQPKSEQIKSPAPTSFQNDGSFMDMVRAMNKSSNGGGCSTSQGTDVSKSEAPVNVSAAAAVGATSTTSGKKDIKSKTDTPSQQVDLKRKIDNDSCEEVSSSNNSSSRSELHNKMKVKNSRFKAKPQQEKVDPADEYLRQVQQLQDMDKGSDSTGGKWLVR